MCIIVYLNTWCIECIGWRLYDLIVVCQPFFLNPRLASLPAEVLDRFQDLPATYAFHDVRSVWILCIEELNHVGDQMPCTAGNDRLSKRSNFALAKYFKVVEMAGFSWLHNNTAVEKTLWNILQIYKQNHYDAPELSPCPLQNMEVSCCSFSLPAGMLPDGMQGIIRKATRYLSTFSTGPKEGDLKISRCTGWTCCLLHPATPNSLTPKMDPAMELLGRPFVCAKHDLATKMCVRVMYVYKI